MQFDSENASDAQLLSGVRNGQRRALAKAITLVESSLPTHRARAQALIDEITFVAYPARGVSVNLCIGRDTSSGQQFSPREIEACHRIAPIICALADAHWAGLITTPGPADDVSAALARVLQSVHDIRLSPRQAEVALLILRGHSTVSIALRLGVAAQTVKVFRKQLYSRCKLSSQAELFALMLPLLKGVGFATGLNRA